MAIPESGTRSGSADRALAARVPLPRRPHPEVRASRVSRSTSCSESTMKACLSLRLRISGGGRVTGDGDCAVVHNKRLELSGLNVVASRDRHYAGSSGARRWAADRQRGNTLLNDRSKHHGVSGGSAE